MPTWRNFVQSWFLRGLALLVFAWMLYDLIFSTHGYLVYRSEQQQLQVLQQQLHDLKAQREVLAKDILRLRHDPHALEDLVHKELGYVFPDEFMLIMPDEKQAEELK